MFGNLRCGPCIAVPAVKARWLKSAFAFCASLMMIGHADSVAKDIYLAARQDGHRGKGIATDPFDAGTAAKYDELLARFNQDTNFHYAPGIYETSGWFYRKRQTVNPNCHHYGAGIDRTILKLVGAHDPTQDGAIFGHDYDKTADGFEVHDMTLDANALGNPKFVNGTGRVGCAGAVGNNILFSNLKFIHFGTRHKGDECFALICFAGTSQVGKNFTNVRLENSVFTDPAPGNVDGLTCAGMGAAEGASLDGTIINCRFIHVKADFLYSQAFGAAHCEHNYVEDCDNGFYTEPIDHQAGTFTIRNNTFRDVLTALTINWHQEGSMDRIDFENNDVAVRNQGRATGIWIDDNGLKPGDRKPNISAFIVRNNRFSVASPPETNHSAVRGVLLTSHDSKYTIGKLIIEDNHFDLPANQQLMISRPPNVIRSFLENRNTDEKAAPALARDEAGHFVSGSLKVNE